MKIKVFKSIVMEDGGLASEGEKKINEFMEGKKIIDVKTNINQLDGIADLIITVLYE